MSSPSSSTRPLWKRIIRKALLALVVSSIGLGIVLYNLPTILTGLLAYSVLAVLFSPILLLLVAAYLLFVPPTKNYDE
jgi:hypothetical protein